MNNIARGFILAFVGVAFSVAPAASLTTIRKVTLEKKSGKIDQVVLASKASYIVRDSTWKPPEQQRIEVFSLDGKLLRRIGQYGNERGTYRGLKAIALAGGELWYVDASLHRITRVDYEGKVIGSILIAKPGYMPLGLAIDVERGKYYVSGLLPQKTYLDDGSSLVHQYELSSHEFVRSWLANDADVLAKNLLSVEDLHLDLDPQGRVWVAEEPIHKVWRLDPAKGQMQSFALTSSIVRPVPRIDPKVTANLDSLFVIDRLAIAGSRVFVSVQKPDSGGYLLFALDGNGKQVAGDMRAPGRLVGSDGKSTLYFAESSGGAYRIIEAVFDPAGKP